MKKYVVTVVSALGLTATISTEIAAQDSARFDLVTTAVYEEAAALMAQAGPGHRPSEVVASPAFASKANGAALERSALSATHSVPLRTGRVGKECVARVGCVLRGNGPGDPIYLLDFFVEAESDQRVTALIDYTFAWRVRPVTQVCSRTVRVVLERASANQPWVLSAYQPLYVC